MVSEMDLQVVEDWVMKSFATRVRDDGYLLSDEFFVGMNSGQKKLIVRNLRKRGFTVQRVGDTAAVIKRV